MTETNYLPFDLETALKEPHRVICRNGTPVTDIAFLKSDGIYRIAAVRANDVLSTYTIEGAYLVDENDGNDLMLLPESKVYYCNVYADATGGIYHNTVEQAISNAIYSSAIGILEITIVGKSFTGKQVHTY